MTRWPRLAAEVSTQLPTRPPGVRRILAAGDFHNRGWLWHDALTAALWPDVVLLMGDYSGLDPLTIDAGIVHWGIQRRAPTVAILGNHDTPEVATTLRLKGIAVIDQEALVLMNDVRIWSWPDPNHTRWGRKDAYSTKLCREQCPPMPIDAPYLVAVHCSVMIPPPFPAVTSALVGHDHAQHLEQRGSLSVVHVGTAGGGGLQRPGRMGAWQCAVVDVTVPEHQLAGLWFVECDRRSVSVVEAAALAGPAPSGHLPSTGRIPPAPGPAP